MGRGQRLAAGEASLVLTAASPLAGGELMTQFLAAVEVRELGAKAGSLEAEGERVLAALDLVLTGV